jgi:hypothetical protein
MPTKEEAYATFEPIGDGRIQEFFSHVDDDVV